MNEPPYTGKGTDFYLAPEGVASYRMKDQIEP